MDIVQNLSFNYNSPSFVSYRTYLFSLYPYTSASTPLTNETQLKAYEASDCHFEFDILWMVIACQFDIECAEYVWVGARTLSHIKEVLSSNFDHKRR
jgi:hypothetical protein